MAAADAVTLRVDGVERLGRNLSTAVEALNNLDFTGIARQGARLAASSAPRRTGRLAGSVRGGTTRNRAVVTAGGTRVLYAAPINYGWRRRRLAPTHFMQRADTVWRRTAPAELEQQVVRIIAARGLR